MNNATSYQFFQLYRKQGINLVNCYIRKLKIKKNVILNINSLPDKVYQFSKTKSRLRFNSMW